MACNSDCLGACSFSNSYIIFVKDLDGVAWFSEAAAVIGIRSKVNYLYLWSRFEHRVHRYITAVIVFMKPELQVKVVLTIHTIYKSKHRQNACLGHSHQNDLNKSQNPYCSYASGWDFFLFPINPSDGVLLVGYLGMIQKRDGRLTTLFYVDLGQTIILYPEKYLSEGLF